MSKALSFYSEHVQVQVVAVIVPYLGYVVAWFARSLVLAEWALYGICIALAAVLTTAVGHRIAKKSKRARSSLDAFCVMFLLAFLTVLILSPLSFRRG